MTDFDPIDDEMRLDDISRNDDQHDENYEQETDIDSGVTTTDLNEVERENIQTCVDNFYDEVSKKYSVVPNTRAKLEDFVVVNGEFRYRKYPNVKITNKNGTKFLSPSSIMNQRGGSDLLKDIFDNNDITKLIKFDVGLQKHIGEESQLENRLKSLNEEETAVKKSMSADEISNELSSSLKRMSEQIGKSSFSDREYVTFDRFIQTAQGNLHVQREKLASINADINKISEQLKNEIDEQEITKLKKELVKLEDLKGATLESIQMIRKQYINQIANIKSTIQSILHEDTTLAERIKTLFREQGITIASVLTAFGMIISTIVVSLTGGGGEGAVPANPNGVKEWVKKTLDKLANFLKYLGEKAVAALPGIIGSIFSWLLNTASKAVGWLANYAWFTIASVGILIISYVEKKFLYIYNKK